MWKARLDTVKEGRTKLCHVYAERPCKGDSGYFAHGLCGWQHGNTEMAGHLFVGAVQTQAAGLLVCRHLEAGHIILGDSSRTVGMRQRCSSRIPCIDRISLPR